ncbi:MAG TPA: inositol monophosphatase family protein [Solirubrobacteraceae bacterium]
MSREDREAREGSEAHEDREAAAGSATAEPSPQALCEIAVRAARGAGALLLERFQGGEQQGVMSKSTPTDLVSEADLAAERAIRAMLAELRPEDGFLGEESGGESGSSGLRWVVDPLDGTVNFLFGIPQWCVSVAVRDEEGSLAGAIYDPCRGELFTAVRGEAPKLKGPSGERALTSPLRDELSTAMVTTGLAYDARVRAAQAKVLARLIPHVRDIRRFGSAALDLAWTAAGRFDAYFERTVKPWDIAAGTLICEGAGLAVLELPEREDLPWGILVAPPALCAPLLEFVDSAD